MKKISLICLATISAFAYFNESNYDDVNYNNEIDSFAYYAEGIHSANIYINKELGSPKKPLTVDLLQKQVLIELPNNDIANIVFFKEIGQRALGINPEIIKDKTNNRFYVLFANNLTRTEAKEVAKRLKEYQFEAQIVDFTKIKANFEYFDWLPLYLNNAVRYGDYSALVNSNNYTQTNVSLVNPAYQPNNGIKAEYKNNSNTKNARKAQTKKNTKTKTNEVGEGQEMDKATRECLGGVISALKRYGLFNINSLQFKMDGIIYSKNDEFSYRNCKFKITEIIAKNNIFTITFDNYAHNRFKAKIQNIVDGFVPLNELLYSPYEDTESKLSKKSKQSTYSQDNQNQSNALANNQSSIATETENNSKTSNIDENKVPKVKTKEGSYAICSFNLKTGIRTRVERQADGAMKVLPIYDFYKGKEGVKVDYYANGDYYSITSLGGQTMLINAKNFKQGCKVE